MVISATACQSKCNLSKQRNNMIPDSRPTKATREDMSLEFLTKTDMRYLNAVLTVNSCMTLPHRFSLILSEFPKRIGENKNQLLDLIMKVQEQQIL